MGTGLSKYPDELDTRENNTYFELNDETMFNEPEDINVLQDAIMAIETRLGTLANAADDSITKQLTTIAGDLKSLLDAYKPHCHNGDGTSTPGQINLSGDKKGVTGQLPSANLLLGGETGLTADKIPISNNDDTKIKSIIEGAFPACATTGTGASQRAVPITGNLFVQSNFYDNTHAQFDTQYFPAAVGLRVVDSNAFTGYAMQSTNQKGLMVNVYTEGHTLRYSKYALCIRLKLSGCSSANKLATMVVANYNFAAVSPLPTVNVTPSGGSGKLVVVKDIYQSDFANANYTDIYMTYEHIPVRTVAEPNLPNQLFFGVNWLNVGQEFGTLTVDSIIVTPLHTSVYDD